MLVMDGGIQENLKEDIIKNIDIKIVLKNGLFMY